MTYVSESFWHDAVNKATTDLFTFGYKHIIKPNFVFNHRPDEAHDQMIEFCHVVKNVPPLLLAEQLMLDYTDPILETNVMGVDFTNPFGLSGGPCTNASTELIRKVYKEYGDRFAIAGIGGVFTPEQAYAKIRSGSSLVMFISSLMYRGPQQITVLKRGLAQLLRRDGFEHVSDAVGVDVE